MRDDAWGRSTRVRDGRHQAAGARRRALPASTWLGNNKDRTLLVDTFKKFLRAQHARNISGRIVGWYDEARNEYEVRVSGRLAILVATETTFGTTGAFSMWAQELEKSEEELASGRLVMVQIYREWPLYQAIYQVARARGPEAKEGAIRLLRELVRRWEESYCYKTDPLDLDCDGSQAAREKKDEEGR